MKHAHLWIAAALLLSFISCTRESLTPDYSAIDREAGVYGYLTPIVDDSAPATKASVDPDNSWQYIWETGDRINIWSQTGTLLVYTVIQVSDNGRAQFDGGGFTLTDGETYYSSHPLIQSVRDNYNSLTTTYEGQVQSENNNARHLADYTYTYSSSTCTNGNTSFQYHHLSSFLRLVVTLPDALTITELSLTADSDLFALDGTVDITTGTFTPGTMSNTMTMKLDNVQVSDKVLKAFMAVAPYAAGEFILRVKDSDGKVYTSAAVSKNAIEAGHASKIAVEVFEGANPAVAKIGTDPYETLQAALDAAHETTGDVTVTLLSDITGYAIIHQKADLNLTVEGDGKTITGQIFIDGDGRSTGTETLTINNVKFEGSPADFYTGTDSFILVPSTKDTGKEYSTGNYNYAHNITVSNCSFTSTSSALDVVGNKATSGAGAFNYVITGCTGTNLHSLAQLTGTTGGALTNNTVTASESFVNVSGGAGEFTISGNSFTTFSGSNGYGVRENGTSSAVLNLSDNDFTAFDAVKLGKGSSATAGTINVTSGTYNGNLVKEAAATGKIVITGGTFSVKPDDEFIAEGYQAVKGADDKYTVSEKPDAAKIGEVSYKSLQQALDAAHETTGDVTVTLLSDITGYAIIHQKADLNLTVEGDGKTITGQIFIDGDGRSTGTETLTINNVKFEGSPADFYTGTDSFILVPSTKDTGKEYSTGNYNYAHNITVSNCSFTSTSSALDVVGNKATSGAGAFNYVITGCTGTNLHSLAQLTGTTGGALTNNTVTASESFVNVSGGAGEFTISGNSFTTFSGSNGYGVRENGTSSAVLNLSDNDFTAFDAVKLGKGSSATAGTINVTSGTYNGNLVKEAAATGSIVITGGTFSENPSAFVAEGYQAVLGSDGKFTVSSI